MTNQGAIFNCRFCHFIDGDSVTRKSDFLSWKALAFCAVKFCCLSNPKMLLHALEDGMLLFVVIFNNYSPKAK